MKKKMGWVEVEGSVNLVQCITVCRVVRGVCSVVSVEKIQLLHTVGGIVVHMVNIVYRECCQNGFYELQMV